MSGHEPNSSGPPAWQKVWRATEWWGNAMTLSCEQFLPSPCSLTSLVSRCCSVVKTMIQLTKTNFWFLTHTEPCSQTFATVTHTITASVMVYSCAGGHLLHTRSCLPLLQLFVVQVLIIAVIRRTGDKVRGDEGNLASNVQYIVTHPLKKHWDTWYYTGM